MWIVLSLTGMLCMAAMSLCLNQLNRLKVDPAVSLLCLFAMILAINIVYIRAVGSMHPLPKTAGPWVVLAVAAAASFFGNLCFVTAMKSAPNPGYPVAIEGAKALVVTLASLALFASQLSLIKGLGVLSCAVGVALICL
jgi:hypothetical protein